MLQAKIVAEPIPDAVVDAIAVIAAYLKLGGWREAIIGSNGGASFHLQGAYDGFFVEQQNSDHRNGGVSAERGRDEPI